MSNYSAFDVFFDNSDGTTTPVADPTVHVRDITGANPATGAGAAALPDIVTASNPLGHIPPGTLSIAAGRTVRFFWVRDVDGRCGSAVTVTS